MAADLGVGDIGAYRERLRADFDFGGVIASYLDLGEGAKDAFLADMVERKAPGTPPTIPNRSRSWPSRNR